VKGNYDHLMKKRVELLAHPTEFSYDA